MSDSRERLDRPNPHYKLHIPRKKRRVALGAAVLIIAAALIVTIVISIGKAATGFVKGYFGPDETNEYFESYVSPAIMFDPSTFTDIEKADSSWKTETAIWSAINDNEKNGTYTTTSDGREIIPVKDVTNNFQKYFGKSAVPKYKSFSHGEFNYEYSSKEQCFYIPLIAVTDYYLPKVTKLDRNFNTVTLTVGYIPSKNWGQDSEGNPTEPKPEKYMKIVLNGSRGNYAIQSIEETGNTSGSSTTASSAAAGSNPSDDGSDTSSATDSSAKADNNGDD